MGSVVQFLPFVFMRRKCFSFTFIFGNTSVHLHLVIADSVMGSIVQFLPFVFMRSIFFHTKLVGPKSISFVRGEIILNGCVFFTFLEFPELLAFADGVQLSICKLLSVSHGICPQKVSNMKLYYHVLYILAIRFVQF